MSGGVYTLHEWPKEKAVYMTIASSRDSHDLLLACGAKAECKRVNMELAAGLDGDVGVLLRLLYSYKRYDGNGTYTTFWQWMQERHPLAVLLRGSRPQRDQTEAGLSTPPSMTITTAGTTSNS